VLTGEGADDDHRNAQGVGLTGNGSEGGRGGAGKGADDRRAGGQDRQAGDRPARQGEGDTEGRDAAKTARAAEKALTGEQATLRQAVWAASQAGAAVKQLVERSGLSPAKVREAIASGPFGRKRAK